MHPVILSRVKFLSAELIECAEAIHCLTSAEDLKNICSIKAIACGDVDYLKPKLVIERLVLLVVQVRAGDSHQENPVVRSRLVLALDDFVGSDDIWVRMH